MPPESEAVPVAEIDAAAFEIQLRGGADAVRSRVEDFALSAHDAPKPASNALIIVVNPGEEPPAEGGCRLEVDEQLRGEGRVGAA